MINRYGDFIFESVLRNLILESKLIYSDKFTTMLSNINSDISKKLLDIKSTDVNTNQNFIDISDKSDFLTFTQNNRIENKIKQNQKDLYVITDSSKYLTHSDKNDGIFEALGYNKNEREVWAADKGAICKILAETTRPTGKTFVLLEEVSAAAQPRKVVVNKNYIQPYEISEKDFEIIGWQSSRNPIKVGKLIRTILNAVSYKFTDKDIEDFVNLYKARYDIMNDALSRFDIVDGEDIRHWYHVNNYERVSGTLGGSCMRHDECQNYLDIYIDNPNIKLVILYSESGDFDSDGKYRSDHIVGRAILWENILIDGKQATFMDRIYTSNDSDVELFKDFAVKNGWWYKFEQDASNDCYISDGSSKKQPVIIADLKYCGYEYYPYLDTLAFLNRSTSRISNNRDAVRADCELNGTEGVDFHDFDASDDE